MIQTYKILNTLLVSAYSFYELENNANDTVGTRNGTVQGGMVFGNTGSKYGTYHAAPSSVGEYVTLPAFGSGHNSFSVSAWIRRDSAVTSSNHYIFYVNNIILNHTISLTISSANTANFSWNNNTDAGFMNGVNIIPIDSTWRHIVAVYDGPNNKVELYWENLSEGSDVISDIALDFSTVSNSGIAGASITRFPGEVDHVIVFDAALTASQVSWLYNNAGPNVVSTTPPVSDTRIKTTTDHSHSSDTKIILSFTVDHVSDTRIKRLTGGIIGKLSETKIMEIWDEQLISVTAIFRAAYQDVQLLSSTTIVEFQAFDKFSDSRIKVLDNELMYTSDSFIIHQTDIPQLSDTLILKVTDNTAVSDVRVLKTADNALLSDSRVLTSTDSTILSGVRIKDDFVHFWLRSNTHISNRIDYTLLSQTAVKRLAYNDIVVTSDTEIVRLTDMQLLSNTSIQLQQETSEQSITTIAVRTDMPKTSDTLIMGRYEVIVTSGTTIVDLDLGTKLILLSSTRIERPDRPSVDLDTSTAIVTSSGITHSSNTTIVGRLGRLTAKVRKIANTGLTF